MGIQDRLESEARLVNNASLFDRIRRDLRCIALGMPDQRKRREEREKDYTEAIRIMKSDPRFVRSAAPLKDSEIYKAMAEIAQKDDYKGGPKIEPLMGVMREYNLHYIDKFRGAQ